MSYRLLRTVSKTVFAPILGVLACLAVSGWARPTVPANAARSTAPGQRLDYMVVKINEEPHILRDGDELGVMWGDQIEVTEAVLVDRSQSVSEVNVVGYRSPSGHAREDRGYPFKTHQLKPSYSENKAGEVYAVTAATADVLYGVVYLRLVAPVLRYAEVRVNGASRLVRDGEPLSVGARDQFKVEKVVTNLMNNSDVLFRVVAGSEPGRYQIRFERDRRVFAAIPLRVLE